MNSDVMIISNFSRVPWVKHVDCGFVISLLIGYKKVYLFMVDFGIDHRGNLNHAEPHSASRG
ncbi:hypothetical protein GCM10008013_42650 [Paenibacillus segetis]|uniref:Uncharacterized protein n=1 Tax=Paenibacillus segetis TaxID=1325360 RepID=A0ABQ1YRH3_9BACL|nr:hypothetical protein GCM10008013_42650 [Paenibacillus segetis]